MEQVPQPSLDPQQNLELVQQTWEIIEAQVKGFKDGLGKGMDEGIIDAVVALNVLGFQTRQSCEGHLDQGIAAPWVDIQVEGADDLNRTADKAFELADEADNAGKPYDELEILYKNAHALKKEARRPILEEAIKVMELLKEFYQDHVVPYDQKLTIKEYFGFFRIESEGALVQDGFNDDTKKQKLIEYRQEMNDFAVFLKKKYFLQSN